MLMDVLSPMSFFVGIIVSFAASNFFNKRLLRVQQEIVQRGELTQGKVIALSTSAFTGRRVHFEFQPLDSTRVVRCWHTDCRDGTGPTSSLPQAGTHVQVRYLADKPERAVIARLVSRFVRD